MTLSDSIAKLRMVGPIYAKRLEKLGIFTIEDLLYHFPFRYDDFSIISPISRLQVGETVTVTGKLEKITNTFTKTGKRLQEATITDDTGSIEAVWFNQVYLVKTFKIGENYNFSGKVEWFGHKKVLLSPEYEQLKPTTDYRLQTTAETIHTGRLVPIYPETYGVSSKWLRSRIKIALEIFCNHIEEFLPDEIRNNENLMPEIEAVRQIHFPQNHLFAQQSKYRLAFDELFLIQLAALERKNQWQKQPVKQKMIIDKEKIKQFIENLPFDLTNAQQRCMEEILDDLGRETPMNRLLEGDVGSGKTVVAAISAYAIFLNGYQTLLMAPTEILAEQHYSTLQSLLTSLGVPIEIITGSRKLKSQSSKMSFQKREASSGIHIDSRLRGNDTDNKLIPKVIVGTHALLFQDFDPQKIGLVIVDEQHRFGVEQRTILAQKGIAPHFLTMTATPIPRTIALTLFGDLDFSVIDEMPKGRISIKTWVVPNEKRTKGYEWIRSRIKNTPEQAFIVCPLIEQSETLVDVKAVTKEYGKLSKEIFPDLRLALLHGKVKSKEKEKILTDFKEGKLDILVTTPVVEVGIDIPNATIMMIEGADRFGLAQLHQLRGRVGRSNLQSYCLLFTENQTQKVVERLKYMEKTNIGMELAEADLQLRGPGEIYGTRQHGFPDLKIASFSDLDLIQKTRTVAQKLIIENWSLIITSNSPLKRRLEKYRISTIGPN